MNHKAFPYRSIAVLGSNGQLGRSLVRAFGDASVAFNRLECDLLSSESIVKAIGSGDFDWVINAAAYTNVDGAESDPKTCHLINDIAVKHVAAACQESGSKLLHISSDYVFGAEQSRVTPYAETDTPGPLSVYATSKLLGEYAAKACDRHLIIRTCGLYSASTAEGVTKNFCNTILAAASKRRELSVVDDQWCTPTYVPHLVSAIESLMRGDAAGIFHVTNQGQTNWYEFASRLLHLAGSSVHVKAIDSSGYPLPARRPGYSVLAIAKFEEFTGASLPHWEDGLAEYVSQRSDLVSEEASH